MTADLLLLHPPAYFDFRTEKHVYFPFMSTSGDVPITPVYEFYPLGFRSLKEYISRCGHDVKIFNLCSFLLQNPKADVTNILKHIAAKMIGIDLHWLVHVQGALEIARVLKEMHPDTLIMFGGISSTYYAAELIQYPFVDIVMRGYDTHFPTSVLVQEVKTGRNFSTVPNILWKKGDGEIAQNNFDYLPEICENGVEWSDKNQESGRISSISDIISITNMGCSNNCGWCGGSKKAFQKLYNSNQAPILKSGDGLQRELASLLHHKQNHKLNFYSCSNYNLKKDEFLTYLDKVEPLQFKSINYEEFYLLEDDILKRMVEVNKKTGITLSPESHDIRISKLAGRGTYTMKKMENWIERALEIGIHQIDVWFFVGMPEQDEKSVMETVDYCESLISRFKTSQVNPYICPLMPFLDPASSFFEQPEKYGYRIFYKTLEQHKNAMKRASIINRLNYETIWMTREQIVKTGYRAIEELFQIKGNYKILPEFMVKSVCQKINDTLSFIDIVHAVDNIEDKEVRRKELTNISEEIYRRNKEVFFDGVLNQAFPNVRKHGTRWFDYQ